MLVLIIVGATHGIVFEESVELFVDGFFDLQIRLDDLVGLQIPRLDALQVCSTGFDYFGISVAIAIVGLVEAHLGGVLVGHGELGILLGWIIIYHGH